MSADVPFTFKTSAEMDRLEERAAPHWRAVYYAMRQHGIAFGGIIQDRSPFRIPRDRPTLLLLGDDLDASHGPAGFHAKSVRRFVERCRYGVVVACSPETVLYATAASIVAATRGDVVLIETRPEHEADWVNRLREIKPGLPLMVGMVRPTSEARH